MPTYSYPTSTELSLVAQEKVNDLTLDDPIFRHFPIDTVNAGMVEWEQEDNYVGLQQARALGAGFPRVKRTGAKKYVVTPMYFGEYESVDESILTNARELGTFDKALDINAEIMRLQDKLLLREVDRMKQIAWNAAYGTYSVTDPVTGNVIATDSFAVQTQSPTAAYTIGNIATIAPLADFRAVALKGRGKGVAFDSRAIAYANQTTINVMLSNTNSGDLGGKLVVNGNNVMSLDDGNRTLLANGLPQIQPYEGGYLDEDGNWQLRIPDGKFIIFGVRQNGTRIGRIVQTRNAQNPNSAPGPYNDVVESREPPKEIKVFRGNNYAPTIEFASSIVILG